jgi:hypothetical protein
MIRRTRASTFSLAVAAALLLSACADNTPNPTDVARAVIFVSVDPTPVIAVASTRIGATFSARFKAVIKETAGQGGEVRGVRATLYDEVTGVPVGFLFYDTADMIVFVGEERVEAGGTLEVPIQIDYAIPGDINAKAARLHVSVDLEDDKGNAVNASALVKVE